MYPQLKVSGESLLKLGFFEPYKECQFAEFSGDGSRLLTVQESEDGIARLWCCESGLQLCTLKPTSLLSGRNDLSLPPSEPVAVVIESIALDMTGRYALLGMNDGTAGVFDCETGVRLSVMHLEDALPNDYGVVAVAFSRDGSLALAAFSSGRVGVFDSTGKEVLGVLSLPCNPRRSRIVSLSVSEDRQYVFAGLCNSDSCLWRLSDYSVVLHSLDHRDTTIELCASGGSIYWATSAGKIWCCQPGAVPAVLTSFASGIAEARFAPDLEKDNPTLVMLRLGNDEVVRLQRDGTQQILAGPVADGESCGKNRGHDSSIIPLSDGSFLFVSREKESSRVCRYSSAAAVQSLPLAHGDLKIAFLAVSPRQSYLAVAYENCAKFDILDLRTEAVISSCEIESSLCITAMSFSPAEDLLAIGADNATELAWWSLANNSFIQRSDIHAAAITCLEFGCLGDSLISASEDRTVRLWKRTAERPSFRAVGGESALVSFAAILKSGFVLLMRGAPELWSADLKALIYRTSIESVQSLWFDEGQDSLLVSGCGIVYCLQLSSGSLLERIEVETVRPDILPAVSMNELSFAFLWALPGGPYLHLPETFRGASCPMRLSADGKRTVVPCPEGAVLISTEDSQPLSEPIFLPCRSDRQPLSGSFVSGDRVLLFCRNGNLLRLVLEEADT